MTQEHGQVQMVWRSQGDPQIGAGEDRSCGVGCVQSRCGCVQSRKNRKRRWYITLLVAFDSLSEISSARFLCLVRSSPSGRLGVAWVEQYQIALQLYCVVYRDLWVCLPLR